MERVLTAHEATIQTVQVEIQTMRVGKKQVTQSLFRQLPHARLLDAKTVQLRGVPWGHVNYWWDGDGSGFGDGRKLHVVWQLGSELRRGVVFQEPDPGEMHRTAKRLEGLVEDWLLLLFQRSHTFKHTRKDRYGTHHTVEMDGYCGEADFDDVTWRILDTYWAQRHLDPEKEAERNVAYMREHYSAEKVAESYVLDYARAKARKEDALQGYRDLLAQRGLSDMAVETIVKQGQEVRTERDAYKDAWAKQWQTLSQLPQLFIAV